jgi:hypothetical protein
MRENRYKKQVKQFIKTAIGKPEQWLIEAAASIGLDFAGLAHELTDHFFNHVKKRHGLGYLSISEKDLELIPEIVKAPDLAVIGAIRKKLVTNAYAKRSGATTYIYFEAVMDSKRNKSLRGSTIYKIVKTLDMENFERIITMNGKTDLTGAKKIIAAGGHPGGEA